MADGVDHIDIYADVGEEFNQEQEYSGHDNVDLYDDVIVPTASNGEEADEADFQDSLTPLDQPGKHTTTVALAGGRRLGYIYNGKRVALYVGNLTWWTTDEDLVNALQGIGVTDIQEIKFYENRANGQSKGFALVSVSLEASYRKVMDLLPKRELHGQNPIISPCNRQSLNQLEMQSRKTVSQTSRRPYRHATPGPPLPPPPSSSAPPGHPPGPPPHMGLLPPPGLPPPAPHVNPAFFPPGNHGGPPPPEGYGQPPQFERGDFRKQEFGRTPSPSLSEVEFEEIMNRNRAISSSAISRAVSDASAGEYGSAIETLVTAISLIKQSKVSSDERCKVLVSSLQDCLHGIESKSYGSGGRKRERSRERDHSRSREKSRRHKERSRSRDRHEEYYRERSRERDRHRDRDRDREREREYRHR
ncbi:unnamed protein product [Lampetra planeri]